MKFSGTNSVNCGSAAKAALTQTVSITCWVNPSDLASGVDHALTGRSAAGIGYSFKSSSTHLRFTTPTVLDHDGNNSILKLNTWQHVAVTVTANKAGGCIFYINGVATDTITQHQHPRGAANVEIGHNHWDQYCIGMMDDVRIYDHILTQKEVQDAMRGGAPAGEQSQPGRQGDGCPGRYRSRLDAGEVRGHSRRVPGHDLRGCQQRQPDQAGQRAGQPGPDGLPICLGQSARLWPDLLLADR